MRELILEKLNEIEERENIKILHCVESGSRAWGFASPDSDYDVRFIYVRPKEFYLRLDKTRDVIEWQLDDTLDINGWDISKTLTLLHSSNPTLFEWNSSPIVYKTTDEWARISKEINRYFVAKSGIYHYLCTAKRNYKEFLLGDMIKYKKYFYVLRPLMAAKWILDKKCAPPMLFDDLVEAELEDELRPELTRLLELKKTLPEMGMAPRIQIMNDYIERVMPEIKTIAETIEDNKLEWSAINDLFFRMVNVSKEN